MDKDRAGWRGWSVTARAPCLPETEAGTILIRGFFSEEHLFEKISLQTTEARLRRSLPRALQGHKFSLPFSTPTL